MNTLMIIKFIGRRPLKASVGHKKTKNDKKTKNLNN
jgi:hypothetical protein